jgi:hypothetical protein
MSRVTYFPRYSGVENAVTNTTLHLFSQINQQSTERLRALLSELLGGEEVPLGLSFEQQRRSANSVPDGSILQEPLHIVIETKVDMGVNVDQLIRHFEAFTHGRTGNYLVLLTKHDVPESQVAGVVAKSKETGVIFKHVTFERLCEQLEDFAQSHETHLWRVVEDFRAYCSEMNLLPDRRKWLRIVPCGTTFNLNVKWDVYYQPTERSYSPHEYLGIYNQKAVQYVGRVAAIYDNDQVGGAMVLKLVDGTGTPEFEQRIASMVLDTKAQVGWDVSSDTRFFCVEKFASTRFVKTSSGGIMGPRFWDITKHTKPGATDAEVADALRQETWD